MWNKHWARDAFFYHIYPLGLCGAADAPNDHVSTPTPRLGQLWNWIGHLQALGVNALYLGPVFESTTHGYDTADYYQVDRRLGDNTLLAELVAALHAAGIRVILDAVFNHVGRDFWAFRDVLAHGAGSPYCGWFAGLDFGGRSPYGDPFSYEGWQGHYDLVKLNVTHPDVRGHLLDAAESWIRDFAIDGLRLDAADCIDPAFLRDLATHTRRLRPDFWLVGEVVHGDYRAWANPETLDSVTNYECYKGLYSSHNDANYFEIAYALERQFGPHGLYVDLPLYNFADNHDVERVASSLHDPAHLYPLYGLLMTMPGVPSIYYGSEWGLTGRKAPGTDLPLRPAISTADLAADEYGLSAPSSGDALPGTEAAPAPGAGRDLARAIARLARVRAASPALRHGDYRQLKVEARQLIFCRQAAEECAIVAVNAAGNPLSLEVPVPVDHGSHLVDLLEPDRNWPITAGQGGRIAHIDSVWPNWLRILTVR